MGFGALPAVDWLAGIAKWFRRDTPARKPMLIAFTGYSGSGKSTACDYLVAQHGFRTAAFADPLKRMAKIAFGFTDEQLWGPSEMRNAPDLRYPLEKCPWCGRGFMRHGFPGKSVCAEHGEQPTHLSPRIALQTLGTEWGRRLYDNVWTEACLRQIASVGGDHCISDLRFRNEADAVHAAGGRIVRLVRAEQQYVHASETSIATLPVDVEIDNRKSLEALHMALDRLVEGS